MHRCGTVLLRIYVRKTVQFIETLYKVTLSLRDIKQQRSIFHHYKISNFTVKHSYQVVFGLVSINFDDNFKVRSVLGTRGHAYKLFKPRCTASIRSNFFAERVINIWNSLPVYVNFSTLKSFHRTIQSVDFSSFLKCS